MARPGVRKIFWRSLLLQSAWSFAGMQALGVSWAMEPLLDELYGEAGEKRVESARRYISTLNTHPFIAPAILGCAAKMEESGEGANVKATLAAVMGPFGGVGDSFFWGALKPMVAVAAMSAVMMGHLFTALIFILFWLCVNIGSRAYFFRLGYTRGRDGLAQVMKLSLFALSRRLKVAASALLGFYLGFVVMGLKSSWGSSEWLWATLVLGATFLIYLPVRRGVDPLWFIVAGTLLIFGVELYP
ncbi:MAG: hypothetical protein C0609_07570 [Deltaproteobacteria bacterium]|nr:MAG: hypothetical protein C0609_07570 [Deltaproteobacteria bacterium]